MRTAKTTTKDGTTTERQNGATLKGNKDQNPYLTSVFIGKIQVSFIKCVLAPDKVIFEISHLKVGIRSLGWDHSGHNPDKRS